MSIKREIDGRAQNSAPAPTTTTCGWFYDHEKVKGWLGSSCNSLLLVSGAPWCGKSFLARVLVETLPIRSVKSNAIVCYHFFGCSETEQTSKPEDVSKTPELEDATNALDKFARKISSATSLANGYNNQGVQAERDPLARFNQALENSQADEIICILDSLDGCTLASLRRFVSILKECISRPRKNGTIKVLATTRPEWDIQAQFNIFKDLEHTYYISLQWESDDIRRESQKDIEKVIERRLNELNIQQHHFKQVKETFLIGFDCGKSPYLWVEMVFEVLTVLSHGRFEPFEWKRLLDASPRESLTVFRKLLEPASTTKWPGLPASEFKGHQHPLYNKIKELLLGQLQSLLGDRPQKRRFVWTRQQDKICNGTALTADGPSITVMEKGLFAIWRAHDGTDQLWWAKLSVNDQDQNPKWTNPEKIHDDAKTNTRPSIASTENTLVALWKGPGGDEGLYYSVCRCQGSQWSWERPMRSSFGSKAGPAVTFSERSHVLAAWRGTEGDELLWHAVFDPNDHADAGDSGGDRRWQKQCPNYLNINTNYRPAFASYYGRLYLAWTSAADKTAEQILVSTRSPGADVWDQPFSVQSHCHSSAAPTLFSFQGKVYVAWRGKGSDCGIWLTPCVAPQDLEHFELPQRLDYVATDSTPAMAEWRGELILIWKGGWDKDQRIWWGSGYFE